jgi:hypothetical protein
MSRTPFRERLVASCAALLLVSSPVAAVQLKHFVLDTPRALIGAVSHGVAVFPDGSIEPLPTLETLASFDEPLGLALAVTGRDAAFLATGHPARVWRVSGGKKELAAELAADQVTALALDASGRLWAATALPATLQRLDAGSGKAVQVAALAEGNLWSLAWYRGALWAGAGNPGRLMRLDGASLIEVAKVPDRHARCLAVAGDTLLVGTSGKGLVLRLEASGQLGVLYDSQFTEIAALAAAADGTVYAAAVTGDPTMGRPPGKGDGEGTVTTESSATTTPSTDKGPATSEIIRIYPSGAAITVHRFTKQIAGALAWTPGGLVIGTGIEGELWQLVDGVPAMLDDLDVAQVTAVSPDGLWLLTQGPVRLLRRGGPTRGTFTSPALDAGQPAAWGEVNLDGSLPDDASCHISFRSGAAAEPDDTWASWSAPASCASGRATAPPGRYLQWRLELTASARKDPRVGRVVVAYQQLNLPPTIKELTIHDPGEVFLKSPPPGDKIVDLQHPDLTGIFTTLDDNAEESTSPGRRYYRVGTQSVAWKAEDPNGDPLLFDIDIQKAGGRDWWRLREHRETSVLAFDTQALADGTYRIRLTASDAPTNPARPLTTQLLSSYFVIDNTPPVVSVERRGAVWEVVVRDASSPITRVELNRDADRWEALQPADGLLDSREERFSVPVKPGAHTLAIRAVDDHHNRATVAAEETP